jgi:Stage II sporulation protein
MLELSVRDSATGAALEGRVTASDPAGRVVSSSGTERSGRVALRLPRGTYRLKVEASRHRTVATAFDLDAGSTLPVTAWLDPDTVPESQSPESTAERPTLEGYVSDAATGRALARAVVSLERAAVQTETDAEGKFRLALPSVRQDDMELPPADRLTVRREGYRPFRSGPLFVANGTARFVVALRRGSEREETGELSEGHKMLLAPDRLALAQSAAAAEPESPVPVPEASPAGGVPVPASIRVGSGCSCASCPAVDVFSLETYVRKGLDDEWVPSWHDESLRAGAIAYRSYAVYRVAHPLRPNYDICSTICCQVLDPTDTHAKTDSATAATAGMIVVNAQRNAPFLAEYAAENNGRECGDGRTGRPDQGWPCIGDAVDAASTFNGHGRGMCQWGTQRWASRERKDFCWIVDHYFNDGGHPTGARSGLIQGQAGRSCP